MRSAVSSSIKLCIVLGKKKQHYFFFQLIVGSDDFDLRVYKEDVMVGETSETEVATILAPLRGSKMAYALANGTVGVYNKLHRVWRVKVICL